MLSDDTESMLAAASPSKASSKKPSRKPAANSSSSNKKMKLADPHPEPEQEPPSYTTQAGMDIFFYNGNKTHVSVRLHCDKNLTWLTASTSSAPDHAVETTRIELSGRFSIPGITPTGSFMESLVDDSITSWRHTDPRTITFEVHTLPAFLVAIDTKNGALYPVSLPRWTASTTVATCAVDPRPVELTLLDGSKVGDDLNLSFVEDTVECVPLMPADFAFVYSIWRGEHPFSAVTNLSAISWARVVRYAIEHDLHAVRTVISLLDIPLTWVQFYEVSNYLKNNPPEEGVIPDPTEVALREAVSQWQHRVQGECTMTQLVMLIRDINGGDVEAIKDLLSVSSVSPDLDDIVLAISSFQNFPDQSNAKPLFKEWLFDLILTSEVKLGKLTSEVVSDAVAPFVAEKPRVLVAFMKKLIDAFYKQE